MHTLQLFRKASLQLHELPGLLDPLLFPPDPVCVNMLISPDNAATARLIFDIDVELVRFKCATE